MIELFRIKVRTVISGVFDAEASFEVRLGGAAYLLTAVIAAVVVPGFLYSQVYGTEAAVAASVPTSGVNAPELVSGDHAVFALVHTLPGGSAKTAGEKVAYR